MFPAMCSFTGMVLLLFQTVNTVVSILDARYLTQCLMLSVSVLNLLIIMWIFTKELLLSFFVTIYLFSTFSDLLDTHRLLYVSHL
mmetsp:Transcript_3194/g.5962  ORF Transcript_3194/g.5962 Transcript_3194/m.5962 type:complete len:85 (+) Transcript_3194:337-591(+)